MGVQDAQRRSVVVFNYVDRVILSSLPSSIKKYEAFSSINEELFMMKGVTLSNLGPQATKEIVSTAIQAEKEGFGSVWTITRILWPLRPQTPYPALHDGIYHTVYRTVFGWPCN